MALGVKQMMEAANAAVPKITPAEAREKIAKGNTLVVDVRDGTEVQASGKIAGALVTLCPWWDGPVTRAELEAQLARAQQSVQGRWIWIHHAPPAGSPVCWTGHQFAGDESLLEWIKRFTPDMVFSGHIHNAPFYAGGSWVDQLGKTWVFNPGKQIGPSPTHIIIDFDRMTAEWISLEGQSVRQLTMIRAV